MRESSTQLTGYVATLTLENDRRRNVLTNALLSDLREFLAVSIARRARVAVIRARPRALTWSAGRDVRELPRPGNDPLAEHDSLVELIRAIEAHPLPTLAVIEGGVWGGACSVALACDIRIGTPTCSFTFTAAKMGVPYHTDGIAQLLQTLPRGVLNDMIMTARPLFADRAYALGVLNHLIPAEALEEEIQAITQGIAHNAPQAIATMKQQTRALSNVPALDKDVRRQLEELRRAVYSGDEYAEGLNAFREKRTPRFE